MALKNLRLFLIIGINLFFAFLNSPLFSEQIESLTKLKIKQPNWRPEKTASFENGMPKTIVFYEPIPGSNQELPVKEMVYTIHGLLSKESDLILVKKDSPAILYHGPSITYDERGRIKTITCYYQNVLHGPKKEIYENGITKKEIPYENGIKHGIFTEFHQNGTTAKTGLFEKGKLQGPLTTFYTSGHKKSLIVYDQGLLQGEAIDWYENGEIKSKRIYHFGLLNSTAKIPAITFYYPGKIIQEVQDFTFGIPCGLHIKYHPNGKESYRVSYKQGEKTGLEQTFSLKGSTIAEGSYVDGKAVLKHYKKNDQDQIIFLADYDPTGNLKSPILEFYDEGQKKLHYFKGDKGLNGEFLEWHKNQKLKKKCTYQNGSLSGLYEEFFDNGHPKIKCTYLNQKKEGPYCEWFENGQKREECSYKMGKKVQSYVAYFETGAKRHEMHFNALGIQEGEERAFDESGTLTYLGNFLNDKGEGMQQEWHSNGTLKNVFYCKDGKKCGKEEQFYENAQEKRKAHYKKGLLDGTYTTWFSNGSLHEKKQFLEGVAVGSHTTYYMVSPHESQIEKQLMYRDGKLQGEQKSYFKNGQQEALLHYENNLLHGKKCLWNSQGELLEEAFYAHGLLEGPYYLVKKSGKMIKCHYKNNLLDGFYTTYYPPHKLFGEIKSFEGYYEKGLLQGEVSEYNEAGTKVVSTFYKNGLKDGPVSIYSSDGKIKIAAEFQNDHQQGLAYEYFPSGYLQREVFILDDVKDGVEKIYFDQEDCCIAAIKTFKKGFLHGISQEWNINGTLVFEAEYAHDKKNGLLTKYDDHGNFLLARRYVDDKLVEKIDP